MLIRTAANTKLAVVAGERPAEAGADCLSGKAERASSRAELPATPQGPAVVRLLSLAANITFPPLVTQQPLNKSPNGTLYERNTCEMFGCR